MVHPVDKLVGERIRQLRHLLDISQTELANKVGVKFQQIQKYETGANRVSASRLSDIAGILKVNIGHFFDDQWEARNVEMDKTTLALVSTFLQLTPEQKKTVLKLVKDL